MMVRLREAMIVVVVGVIGACVLWFHGLNTGEQRMLALWNKERAEQSEKLVQSQEKVRDLESQLVEQAATLKKEANDQIYALAGQRDDLRRRLQHAQRTAPARMSCPSPPAANEPIAERDNGAELPATIGEQDVDEALRADAIRIHLLACYKQYDDLTAAIKDLRKKWQQ